MDSPHARERALRAACSSIKARIEFWDGTLSNIRKNRDVEGPIETYAA
jgi:hypothetical protein